MALAQAECGSVYRHDDSYLLGDSLKKGGPAIVFGCTRPEVGKQFSTLGLN